MKKPKNVLHLIGGLIILLSPFSWLWMVWSNLSPMSIKVSVTLFIVAVIIFLLDIGTMNEDDDNEASN